MKKRVIIPVVIISGIVIFGVLATALNPVVYRKSFMLGNDKMSVVPHILKRSVP